MHFPWSEAKVTFHIYSIFGDNIDMDISSESPIMPDQEGIFEDGDELGGIYDENLDYEVVKCVKYRQDGDLVLEATYGGFSIQEIDEDTAMCKAGDRKTSPKRSSDRVIGLPRRSPKGEIHMRKRDCSISQLSH